MSSNVVLPPDMFELGTTRDSYPTSHLDELPQHNIESPNSNIPTSRSIQFNELTRVAHELIRSIANDSVMSRNVYTILFNGLIKSLKRRSLILYSISLLIVLEHQMRWIPTKQSILLWLVQQKNVPTSSASKRIIYSRERNLPNRISNQSGRKQECSQISKRHSYAKSCGLSRGKSHTKMKYYRLLQGFGMFPVPLIDMSQRKKYLYFKF